MDARVVNVNSLPISLGLIAFGLVQFYSCLQCGVPQIRHEALIVRGSSTRQGEWPWHAAIFHRKGRSSEYACGGTLINDHFVLTAAHCAVNKNTGIKLTRRGLFVRLGVYNLDITDLTRMQEFSVEDIYTFGKFQRENMRNDIALLKLKGSVQITNYVAPACINRQSNLTNVVGTSIGWGVTENEKISPVLKMARLPVIDDFDCMESDRDLFGKLLDKGMFCAGSANGTSICNGDSGGGLFFEHGEAWYLGGIVSFSRIRGHGSNLCHTKSYTAFTKVVKYLPWISNITGIVLDVGNDIMWHLPTPVIKRKNVPYIPRLSDEKCLEYQRYKKLDSSPNVTPFIYIYIEDQGVSTCRASVISERYLLSTGSCFHSTFDNASFTSNLYNPGNPFPTYLKPILHPNHTATTYGYVPKGSVILLDLGRDYLELIFHIECLWTDPNEITKEIIRSGIGHQQINLTFNISETNDEKAVITNEENCNRIMLGLRLMVQKVGEDFHRLVGPMIDCEPTTYARLTDYLDWIEETVWPRKT